MVFSKNTFSIKGKILITAFDFYQIFVKPSQFDYIDSIVFFCLFLYFNRIVMMNRKAHLLRRLIKVEMLSTGSPRSSQNGSVKCKSNAEQFMTDMSFSTSYPYYLLFLNIYLERIEIFLITFSLITIIIIFTVVSLCNVYFKCLYNIIKFFYII